MQIDKTTVLELAAFGPEIKQYLEGKFPSAFWSEGDYLFSGLSETLLIFDKFTYVDAFNSKEIINSPYSSIENWSASAFRKATTEEIQRFIPDYKPETL